MHDGIYIVLSLSPHTIVACLQFNYTKHCQLKFGTYYVQTLEDTTIIWPPAPHHTLPINRK